MKCENSLGGRALYDITLSKLEIFGYKFVIWCRKDRVIGV